MMPRWRSRRPVLEPVLRAPARPENTVGLDDGRQLDERAEVGQHGARVEILLQDPGPGSGVVWLPWTPLSVAAIRSLHQPRNVWVRSSTAR